ncbi:efflux transporter outer membrane subunit [Elongatibacter sediminis]|uniref:Efflux transporter outer membrane subunit n=1 Tax=Elongatibacter sediminis TaxID=3119006 RepID=A0AAW9RC00_9GAMM
MAVGVLAAVVLHGCVTVGPDYQPPEPQAPAEWQAPHNSDSANDGSALTEWWRQFEDPVLEALVSEALTSNTDLATARASLREARAQRALTAAQLGPAVDFTGSASRSDTNYDDGTDFSNRNYSLGLDASWEADVFGGQRRGVEAADADVGASVASLAEVRISLAAEVALNYIDLRTAERRLAVAQANLAAQEETFQLTQWRHQAGLASELEEAQALTSLETTLAGLPPLETAAVAARNRLTVLLNRNPGTLNELLGTAGQVPRLAEDITVGIPAETLSQRPDVRTAERRLAAQTARLVQAQAARYPSLRLSGSIGLEALTLSALEPGGTRAWSLLGAITAPVFDSGRIDAAIDIEDARLEQALLAYRSAVLTALEDVENALTSVAQTRERQVRLSRATDTARRSLELAEYRYRVGLIDFLSVLDSQRTVQGLEDQLASSEGELAVAHTQLFKALGGGWSSNATETSPGKS